jgi:hypothetical protein
MRVFVSYRRGDSQDIAARIADRLADEPGISEVFFDVDDIVPGADFVQRIDQALKQSQVSLILIGSGWTGSSTAGGRTRIFDADDFVRHEVATSLSRGNRVVPVLLNDATIPAAEDLPEDIRAIATRNAVFIRHTSFNQDMELLVEAVSPRKLRGRAGRWLRRHPFIARILGAVGGLMIAGATLVGLAVLHSELTGGIALEQTLGGKGTVWLLIILVLALGAALPLWLLRRE